MKNIHKELNAPLLAGIKGLPSTTHVLSAMLAMYRDAHDIFLSAHGEVKGHVTIFLK